MKKTLSILTIVLIVNSANSQETPKTLLQEMNLKGKVRSVRETSYQAVKNKDNIQKGKRKMESPDDERDYFIVFNDYGYKTEKNEFNSDGSVFRKLTYQYDDKKNVIEEDRYDAVGNLANKNKFSYQYDNKGNTIEKDWQKSDGSIGQKVNYKYDDNGNLIETKWYKPDGNIEESYSLKRDEKGNVIEKNIIKPDGSISWKFSYKYDNNNKIIEENQYRSSSSFIIKYINNYDDKGNLNETDWCKSNGKPYRKYTYNYEYDKNGNWIKQTLFENDKPMYIIERDVEYFNM